MARRVAEVIYVGDARSLMRASRIAAAETKRTAREMTAMDRLSRTVGSGLRNLGQGAAYAGAAIGAGLVIEAKRSVEAFREAELVQAQTAAGLKSTGRQANVTARGIQALALATSRKTGIDDEAVQTAENMLLTFTKVRNEAGRGNDIFTRATTAIADMATKMNGGAIPSAEQMQASTVRLGKALNDPVKGVTALTKAGVQFTDQQKAQIATLVESGDMLGAQKVILRELQTQFGGAGRAAGDTAQGGMAKLRNEIGNIEEAIGRGLSPALVEITASLRTQAQQWLPIVERAASGVERVFARKDLSLGQKFSKGFRSAKVDLSPIMADIRAGFGRLDLGSKLGDAVEKGTPQIMNAMAAAAPRAAGTFVRAFVAAGPAAKLFTLALIAGKLGMFSAAGGLAATKFAAGFAAGSAKIKAAIATVMAAGAVRGGVAATAAGAIAGGGFLKGLARKATPVAIAAIISEGITEDAGVSAEREREILAMAARSRAAHEKVRKAIDGVVRSGRNISTVTGMLNRMLQSGVLNAKQVEALRGELRALPAKTKAEVISNAKEQGQNVDKLRTALGALPSSKTIQIYIDAAVRRFNSGGGGGITGKESKLPPPQPKAKGSAYERQQSVDSGGNAGPMFKTDAALAAMQERLTGKQAQFDAIDAAARREELGFGRVQWSGRPGAAAQARAVEEAKRRALAVARKKGKGVGDARRDFRQARNDAEDAARALFEFNREAKRAETLARIEVKIKGLERVKAYNEALKNVASTIKDKLDAAVSGFQSNWEDTTGKALDRTNAGVLDAFDKATLDAVANGPAARRLAQLQADADAVARSAEDAANAQSLQDAKRSGDPRAIAAAEAAIVETARQRSITVAQADAESERAAIESRRAAERQAEEDRLLAERKAKLDADTEAFRSNLQKQTDAELAALGLRQTNYAAFAAKVNAILREAGVPEPFSGSADEESAINAGPAAPTAPRRGRARRRGARASGGLIDYDVIYRVNEVGAESIVRTRGGQPAVRPASVGGGIGGGGLTIENHGSITIGSQRAAKVLADRWSYRARHG